MDDHCLAQPSPARPPAPLEEYRLPTAASTPSEVHTTESAGVVRSPFWVNNNPLQPVKTWHKAASNRKACLTQRAASRSSRFKGVTKRKGDRWMAYLYCRGRQHNSREFHNELEAARWYDAKASELLGAAAVLNFPQDTSSYSSHHLQSVPEGLVNDSTAASVSKGLCFGIGQPSRAHDKTSKVKKAQGSKRPAAHLMVQGMLPLFQGHSGTVRESIPSAALQQAKTAQPSQGSVEDQQPVSVGSSAARPEAAVQPDQATVNQSLGAGGQQPLPGLQLEPGPPPYSGSMSAFSGPFGPGFSGAQVTPCHGSLDFLAAAAAEVAGLHDQSPRQFKEAAATRAGFLARDSGDKSWLTRSSRSAFTSVSKRRPQTAPQPTHSGLTPVNSPDSAQPRPADFGSLRPCGLETGQEQRTLSSCSGSTVSLNARLDHSETQSARAQQDSDREIPRWGAKRRATSRCHSTKVGSSPQEPSSPPSARESQPTVAAFRQVPAAAKPDWMPATPLRQHIAASGSEQQPSSSASLQLASREQPQSPRQIPHSSERQAGGTSASPASQALPTFLVDPTNKRAAFTAWRCTDVQTRLAGTLKQHFPATSAANAPSQPLLAGLQAWTTQEAILRPAATSALQLAPPSLPQVLANTHHHITALKPFWSQPQQRPPSRQWPAALCTSEAQPAVTGAAAEANTFTQNQSRPALPFRSSVAKHARPLSPPPTAASPWPRSAVQCHPSQLSGFAQAAAINVPGHAFPSGFSGAFAPPAQSPSGFPQPPHPCYTPQAGPTAARAANAGFLAHRSSAENSCLTGFHSSHHSHHSAASLHSLHEAARGCLPPSCGQWPLATASPPSAFPTGFSVGCSGPHASHLGGLGSHKRKEHPGPCHEAMPALAGTPFGAPHPGPSPTAARCSPLQPTSLDHAMGRGFPLAPHLLAGPHSAMPPHFSQALPNMSPPMMSPYPPGCIPHGLNLAVMGPHSQQPTLGGLGPNGMFQPTGDPTPEQQRLLHEDVQAHLRAGHELLQQLQCPAELAGMGLADLTNRANMSVSLSAGLPPLAGASAVGIHQQGLAPIEHFLLPGASRAAANGCLEELQQQLSRPDLTAAIKGLGTASLGATLLLKAALQKQQAGSS
ncbi:hypothetical protein WJX74_003295 [Apatococcus lobatus]|uniref:AP2/ERF domain-containing protein n=1 Tax=Apatococcus lobatus TaxID=904363 RepID=A0AAW1QK88_9CHLO